VIQLLALVIPLGLAGAISPVLLTEQTVVLAGPNGRRTARWFAAGAMVTLFAFVCVLVVFGRSISLPKTPHLNATLDVVIGALLLALSLFLHLREPKAKTEKPARGEMNPRAAYAFGTVSMATNFTTLALIIPAAKEIAASHVELAGRFIVALVLVVLAPVDDVVVDAWCRRRDVVVVARPERFVPPLSQAASAVRRPRHMITTEARRITRWTCGITPAWRTPVHASGHCAIGPG
jgi:threonine/homoserine/homoserine lactone efflux protein